MNQFDLPTNLMRDMQKDDLFIYGTLRKEVAPSEFIQNLLDRYAEDQDTGFVQAKLYDLGSYPGLVPSENQDEQVFGEVYKILDSRELLEAFDEYEGCSPHFPEPWEFVRKKMKATLHKGGVVDACIYVYNHDVKDKEQIVSGNYLE